MRLFRLYSGDDQQSHLEELKMPFAPGQLAEQTPLQPATGVIFTRMAPGAFADWHNAPRRQYGGPDGEGSYDAGSRRRAAGDDDCPAERLTPSACTS
jgi:hypothetical protein